MVTLLTFILILSCAMIFFCIAKSCEGSDASFLYCPCFFDCPDNLIWTGKEKWYHPIFHDEININFNDINGDSKQ